jgi:hypothetical protein
MFDANSFLSFSDLAAIARKSGLIRRHSHKFSAAGFLLALLRSVTKGDCSLNHLAMQLGAFHPGAMSRQAMHKRFSPASSSFLLRVFGLLIRKKARTTFEGLDDAPFHRVLIEDSTIISMAKSNAVHFPNNGNGRVATAGCKCLLLTDLLSGDVLSSELHNARDSDQALAHEVLNFCRQGDLIVRDMGFFNLQVLEEIGARDAHWISRLPASVALTTRDGSELRDLLKRTPGNRIDTTVWLGRDQRKRIPCRLVATRLTPADAAKHRRQRKRESKKRGATASKEGLLRDGWRLLVTNMPAKAISAKKINDIYALRWSIEIQFRALKQSCQIKRALTHKSDFFHLEALVLAAMIYQILTLKIHRDLCRKHGSGGWMSIEKTSDFFSIYLLSLNRLEKCPAFEPDLRHLRYERRRRINHWQAIIHSLG